MGNVVPSLEGSLYLTDPQSVIAYQLRKYFRTPKDTIPILGDLIISLPYQVARFGKQPSILVNNIQSDLQNLFNRIFGNERNITVNANFILDDNGGYDVTIAVMYSVSSGEINQTGTTISLGSDGRLKIREDTILPFSTNN